jgi:lipid A 3-O-deacylase
MPNVREKWVIMHTKNLCLKLLLLSVVPAFASSTEAHAGDGIVDEIKLGFLSADTGIGGQKIEHGLDINGEILFTAPQWFVSPGDPEWKKILLAPRPDIGFTANTAGGTSFGYIGVVWTANIAEDILNDHDSAYFSFGAGGAVNNSDLNGDNASDNNKDMGTRFTIHLYAELGYSVTQHVNLSVFYEHYSNAGLAPDNPGMNNVGMRLGYKF